MGFISKQRLAIALVCLAKNTIASALPATCSTFVAVNVDMLGSDMLNFIITTDDQCCSACTNMKDCKGYSIASVANSDRRCYLKSGLDKVLATPNVTSTILVSFGMCPNALNSPCSGPNDCCQEGVCTQNGGGFMCMKQTPSPTCSDSHMNMDSPGNNIEPALQNQLIGDCCASCTVNPNCNAYTFVLYDVSNLNDQNARGICYLKTAPADLVTKTGATTVLMRRSL